MISISVSASLVTAIPYPISEPSSQTRAIVTFSPLRMRWVQSGRLPSSHCRVYLKQASRGISGISSALQVTVTSNPRSSRNELATLIIVSTASWDSKTSNRRSLDRSPSSKAWRIASSENGLNHSGTKLSYLSIMVRFRCFLFIISRVQRLIYLVGICRNIALSYINSQNIKRDNSCKINTITLSPLGILW